MSRRGGCVPVFTGNAFWPLDPRPDEVRIADIAHGLSNLCRFTGATRKFYSVAQHSVHVHDVVHETHGPAAAAWGLLHDASEAYLGDVARPTKYALEGFGEAYREAEARLMFVIVRRFNLVPANEPECVKLADNGLLLTERRDLVADCTHPDFQWPDGEPYAFTIEPWSPERARHEFLTRFYQLAWRGDVRETWQVAA